MPPRRALTALLSCALASGGIARAGSTSAPARMPPRPLGHATAPAPVGPRPATDAAGVPVSEELSTPAGQRRALGRLLHLRGSDWDRCLARPTSFPGLLLAGSFAQDRGCIWLGFFFGDRFYRSLQRSAVVLARSGWAAAPPAARSRLARAWTREVLLRDMRLLDEREQPEPLPRRSGAAPGADVLGWWEAPAGRVHSRRLELIEVRFDGSGDVASVERRRQLER